MLGVAKLAPGAGNIGLLERTPAALPAGCARLAVRAAGICGTDLHIEAGEYPSVPPVTMGHEVCGTVVETGTGVDAGWDGARVVSETYFSTCGHCRQCRAGRPNLCPERRSIGTHVDGAFAESVVVPAAGLHRVPERLDDAAAALCEPLACVCQSLLDPPAVMPGDRVLVVGPGTIGLLAAQVAAAAGGEVEVRGTEQDAPRLALAGRLGYATSLAGADALDEAAYDVTVDCSGAGPGIADALRAARPAGRHVQIGLAGKDVTLPFDLICFKELAVTSGFASTPASWRRALALLERDAVDLSGLVTEVVALRDFRHAFDDSRAGAGVKYVLDPRGGA
jgi:L-iditol 2-dehydrogenase